MFCPNCGKKIEDDSKFCIYCGNEVINFNKDDTVNIIEESMKDVSDVVMQSIENTQESNFGDSGTSTNVGQDPKTERTNTIIGLAIICLVAFLLIKGCGGLLGLFGKSLEINKAEKEVTRLVTSNYGAVPTVKGEVLKDIGNHVLVVVTFEVEIGNSIFDGSYFLYVSDTNQLIMRESDEMPVDFDYETNLEQIKALWGI